MLISKKMKTISEAILLLFSISIYSQIQIGTDIDGKKEDYQ